MADITTTQVAAVYPDKARIRTMICAEAITKGQVVYQTSTGKAGIADANVAGKQQVRGIALESGGAGQAISILEEGEAFGFDLSGMNYDAIAYLSDTAGVLADAASVTKTVNVGRVVAVPDKELTKVLYIKADYLKDW